MLTAPTGVRLFSINGGLYTKQQLIRKLYTVAMEAPKDLNDYFVYGLK
jgi:hypothetical protein